MFANKMRRSIIWIRKERIELRYIKVLFTQELEEALEGLAIKYLKKVDQSRLKI